MAFYLDTSAAVKLVVAEAGSKAMSRWASDHDGAVFSGDLLRTELLRATRRGAPDQMIRARTLLESIILLRVSTAMFERAASLEPLILRSLDAVHLATALTLGDDLAGIVTYDRRMVEAAHLQGIVAVSPA